MTLVADAALAIPGLHEDADRTSGATEHEIETIVPARRVAFTPRRRSELANRLLNILVASIALAVLAPLLVLIGLLVAATSPGPIIYVQTRVGVDRRHRRRPVDLGCDRRTRDIGGKAFHIYKFRSMVANAERNGAVWARQGDARVTPLGRVLRASRLDELPQLVNVLIGDMNIVGPRPERPRIFAQLRESIDEYPRRQLGRPGITGWAQINHRYDTCLDDVKVKVRYDLEYLSRRQSLLEDVRIMLKTIPVMLFARGSM
ncbi:MAG TPA: sugar transferase [Gemmatimonadaceae bacterium]|nr:sugar transferase [Gemmatimonadaceae bacterium]